MIGVVVVGDIRMYRDGVASHLSRHEQFCVLGTACGAAEALRTAAALSADVVIIDMAMPESLQTVRELARTVPQARIVALTVPEIEQAVVACAEAGIAGYVSRDGSLDDLVRVVESAVQGETTMSPRMVACLLRRVSALAADRSAEAARADLTSREREVVGLIEDGLSNKQIAARLNIELATVKNHVHNILEKLHVRRRAEIGVTLGRVARASLFSFDAGLPRDDARR